MMSKKVLILLLSVALLLAISLYGYKGFHKTAAASVIVPDEDIPLRAHIIQLEKNLAATNVLKMTFVISISRNEPKRIIEKFTNYDNKPIEYESITVLE